MFRRNVKKVGGPAYMRPNGELLDPLLDSWWTMFKFAPYGQDNFPTYAREIFANMFKEGAAVLMMSFVIIRAAVASAGPDPFVHSLFIGFVSAVSYFVALSWGYNERLARNLTPGAVIANLLQGRLNWFLSLLTLVVGFAFATAGAGVLYASGVSTIPVIGAPNNTTTGGAFCVQFFFTLILAITVLDQFSTRNGKPRTFPKGRAPPADNVQATPTNPNPLRAYHEDFGRRPMVYAAIVFVFVSLGNQSWGLFVFNGYVYYAGALAAQFLGAPDAFNNGNLGGVGAPVSGAAALFILTDVLAWIVAFGVDWLLTYLHNNAKQRRADDDSNYGGEREREREQPRRRRGQSPTIEKHLNANLLV